MSCVRKDELSDLDRVTIPMMVKAFVVYELLPTVDLSSLISSLMEGLDDATRQFPFMAGSVQVDQCGKPYIVTVLGKGVQCIIQHFAPTESPSFSKLAAGSFCPTDMDETQLLPRLKLDEKPVCVLQLNIIDGGLILGFTMHHSAGDWVSMHSFLSLICRSCQARQNGLPMPLYTPDLNKSPYNGQFVDPETTKIGLLKKCPGYYVIDLKESLAPKPSPPFQTCIYRTTASAIQHLKQQFTPIKEVEYVTSYDCLSAILWKAITRARVQLRPEKSASQTRLLHPIDLRARDPEGRTSKRYFGNGVIPSQAGPLDVNVLLSERGLATASSMIRKSINLTSMASLQDLTLLAKTLEPTERLGYHADFHDLDILMNTWFSGRGEDFHIGGGSLPRAFRTHRPITGACCLVLPNFSPGDTRVYEVIVQLEVEQHSLLQMDTEFSKFFELVA
ncbi:uncharacterized protein N7459_007797 [Penicillium hispanicum]|uniref:uncharacterized protein n=1 Tax=Penicillium hispanicum TaxID=1080232 RepID=UPI0025400561|nr:uncharacterized protein N7459_007797 [Penicillium hispanicum]KAJ5573370.1 hypothetical protein N7459_007797 [Penicillium hispanicum]